MSSLSNWGIYLANCVSPVRFGEHYRGVDLSLDAIESQGDSSTVFAKILKLLSSRNGTFTTISCLISDQKQRIHRIIQRVLLSENPLQLDKEQFPDLTDFTYLIEDLQAIYPDEAIYHSICKELILRLTEGPNPVYDPWKLLGNFRTRYMRGELSSKFFTMLFYKVVLDPRFNVRISFSIPSDGYRYFQDLMLAIEADTRYSGNTDQVKAEAAQSLNQIFNDSLKSFMDEPDAHLTFENFMNIRDFIDYSHGSYVIQEKLRFGAMLYDLYKKIHPFEFDCLLMSSGNPFPTEGNLFRKELISCMCTFGVSELGDEFNDLMEQIPVLAEYMYLHGHEVL